MPVRKAGKLPGDDARAGVRRWSTATAEIEVHADAFAPGDRVLVIDDVLATGGTAAAAPSSWSAAPAARSSGVAVLMELGFLGGRDRVPACAGRPARRLSPRLRDRPRVAPTP